MATSGPGATNLVTPIADAYMDSVPMVAITGQVAAPSIGTDAFQEADIRGITMPITKHSFLVTHPEDIAGAIASAFHIASTGRPGPVLVDITKDALQARGSFEWPPQIDLPGYHPVTKPHAKQVREAARLISASRRPVLYVGGGVVKARAWDELKELAELTGIPVVTTLMARGVFPDSHPQNMGMPGMHGTVAAVGALQRSDLLIALGTRFDDRVTGKLSSFAPGAKVIHADIDPAEISKNRTADVPIVGDSKEVIGELVSLLRGDEHALPEIGAWIKTLYDLKKRYPTSFDLPDDGTLSPQHVIKRIGELTGPDAYYASGVGQHQMWAAHFLPWELPGRWLNSGGLGTMGYCVPAAMGAKVGRPGLGRVGHRRRRLLPDDQPGARHLRAGGDPGQDRRDQQPEPGHGAAVADPVLRGPLLQHRPQDQPRPRLPQARRGHGLRRAARRAPERRRRGDRQGAVDQRRTGRGRVRRAQGRHDLADGRRRRQQRRHQDRPRHGAELGAGGPVSAHTLSVLVQNVPGVLARVSGLVSRRGFNIESLAVGPTESPEISRITLSVDVDDLVLEQMTKQLNKLIEVLKIVELEHSAVHRELILIKVGADLDHRGRVLEILQLFRAPRPSTSPRRRSPSRRSAARRSSPR